MSSFLPEGTRGEGVPEWADGYSAGLYRELVTEVNRQIAHRRLRYAIDADAGVLSFTPPGSPTQQLDLRMLADDCRRIVRGAWDAHINVTIYRMIRAATWERLAADWDYAAEGLRLRFHRECLVRGTLREDTLVWWQTGPGLTPVLEYGLPDVHLPVPTEHAQRWGKPRDELFRIALQNVRSGPRLTRCQGFSEEWGPVESYRGEAHQYPASHLLFLEDYLGPVPPAGVVFEVPTDSAFVLYLLTERANLAYLRKRARGLGEVYLEAYGGVSPHWYWWRDGVFTLLSDPATDEVRPPAEFLEVLNGLGGRG